VKNMNEMIYKGWEINKTIKELQHAILAWSYEVNAITPFISITFNLEFKQHEEEVDDIDLEDSTLEITHNCLNV
jgi:hypothetical protein